MERGARRPPLEDAVRARGGPRRDGSKGELWECACVRRADGGPGGRRGRGYASLGYEAGRKRKERPGTGVNRGRRITLVDDSVSVRRCRCGSGKRGRGARCVREDEGEVGGRRAGSPRRPNGSESAVGWMC